MPSTRWPRVSTQKIPCFMLPLVWVSGTINSGYTFSKYHLKGLHDSFSFKASRSSILLRIICKWNYFFMTNKFYNSLSEWNVFRQWNWCIIILFILIHPEKKLWKTWFWFREMSYQTSAARLVFRANTFPLPPVNYSLNLSKLWEKKDFFTWSSACRRKIVWMALSEHMSDFKK